MEIDYRLRLLAVAQEFARARKLSLSRVSTLVRKDGQFFKRLDAGAGCTVDTYEMILQWFSDRWPEDADWPRVVERPEAAAAEPAKGHAA